MSNRFALFFAPLVLCALFLSACGGGGGGGGGGGSVTPPITPTPTATATLTPTSTTASGKLVDDPNGAPLGGVTVGLAPWVAGATPIPEGTTAPDGTFSFTAPNGHYLLYIGSNLATDTTRPTIHDNVTLTGGAQALKGPVLPPLPLVTPSAVESNGSYRLVTIDPTTEVPCFNAFNAQRTSHLVPAVVEDEWLTENAREVNQARSSPAYSAGLIAPGNSFGYLTSSNNLSGGVNCATSTVPFAFSTSAPYFGQNPNTLWFGGNFLAFVPTLNSASGIIEYPQDPRAFTDPNTTPPVWP